MHKTRNKKESADLMLLLKINQFPRIILKETDESKIKDFVTKYDAKYYAVRDMSRANSKLFNLKVEKENLLEYVKHASNYLINVSSFNYVENQLCTGEIRVNSDMSLSLTVSNNKTFSARDAVGLPDFNFASDVYDKKLKKIAGISQVIDYIFKYRLFDIIVEFSSFDRKVGINNENVIIYELRTDY